MAKRRGGSGRVKAPKQPPVGGFANKGFGRGIGDKTKKPGYGPGSSGRG